MQWLWLDLIYFLEYSREVDEKTTWAPGRQVSCDLPNAPQGWLSHIN